MKRSLIKQASNGFTLVELIIVIAVIGVLAAILIPIFSNVIDKANAKSALSDAKNSMEQVIIEGTENAAMPENILIFVKKAKNFYVYGFNRLTDGCLYQSPGNPFKGFSDVQSLINARSWNALQGDTAPDLSAAYTDHDTYGYFYLVPYSGDVPQTQAVRGMRAANEYPEISDPVNGLMTENMGDDVHIYHGVLTDKVNTEEQTQGDTVATPTPAVTPTPSAEPTPQPTDTWVNPPVVGNYRVEFRFFNWDGTQNYNGAGFGYEDVNAHLDLGLGDNRFTIESLPISIRHHFGYFQHAEGDVENLGYEIIPVEQGDSTFTPLEYLTVHLGDESWESVGVSVYTAVVKRADAPTDNSSWRAGRYVVNMVFKNTDGTDYYKQGFETNYEATVQIYYDLDYDPETRPTITRISIDELIAAGKWVTSDVAGYHYIAVAQGDNTHTPLQYVDVPLSDPYRIDFIEVFVYTALVPNE